MKKYACLLPIVFILSCKSKTADNAKEVTDDMLTQNSVCAALNVYTPDSLKNMFPFKNANEIKLVSFKESKEGIIKQFISAGGQVDSARVDTTVWIESASLNDTSRIRLSDILFNYGFKKTPAQTEEGKGHTSQNAILFYDSPSHIYAAIEYCFSCMTTRQYPDSLFIGDACTGKMDLVKNFFMRQGIKSGTGK